MNQWGVDCLNECKCASDRKLCNPVTGICHCAAGNFFKSLMEVLKLFEIFIYFFHYCMTNI